MRLRAAIVAGLAILAAGVVLAQPTVGSDAIDVSLVNLIATPDKYDGKVVRVVGFLRYQFESQAIYLSEADAKRAVYRNSIWVSFSRAVSLEAPYQRRTPKSLVDIDGEYVELEGIFDANGRGHMSLWMGSLEDVSRASIQPKIRR